jgi:hypothetical protein
MPGLYYLKGGGLILSGQAKLTGYGVTIYNAPVSSSDVINLSGSGGVTLTAPTDGTYAGLTLFQDRNSTNPVTLSGGSGLNITGTVYAAGAVVTLSGGGGLVGSQLIGKDLVISGNGSFKINTQPQLLSSGENSAAAESDRILINSGTEQVLLNSAGDLLSGQVSIAVEGLQGGLAVEEQARIDAAIAALNRDLQPFGVHLVEVSGKDATWAQLHLYLTSSTDLGGVAEGVFGVTEGRDITVVKGWNYSVGTAAAGRGSGLYDFQTVVTHELGHALGLGESTDPASVMYAYLAPGQERHDLTAQDVSNIEAVEDGAPKPLPALPAARDSEGLTELVAPTSPAQDPQTVAAAPIAALPVTAEASPVVTTSQSLVPSSQFVLAAAPPPIESTRRVPVLPLVQEGPGAIDAVVPADGSSYAASGEWFPPRIRWEEVLPEPANATRNESEVQSLGRWQSLCDTCFADQRWVGEWAEDCWGTIADTAPESAAASSFETP